MRSPTLGLLAGAILMALLGSASRSSALEECRLMRQPDIQGDKIAFSYAGDLWLVSRTGGVATRLTSHEGVESFPKFSPDGQTIAFTGEYDGNVDAFSIPVAGGEPKRLTFHPDADFVAEWYPDGKNLLIRSNRASSIQRFSRFFKVPAQGGFEEMLALPTAGYASLSSDGGEIAYVAPAYDNRTWKRYRGGNAPNIWLYDFRHNTSENITADWNGPDEWPMWHDHTIYYCSDRTGRTSNLWAYDVEKKTQRQVTKFADYDVKWPSIGSDGLVFEKGGYLYVMNLPDEKITKLQVLVPDDKPAARAEWINVARWITDSDLSPSARRAVFAARGDIFTVPAENRDPRNLTASPGSRERDPAWSPDGKWIAYLSDKSGEYEIHVSGSDGKTPDRQVTHGGGTFRYAPRWSPDSKKLAFADKTMSVWWCDVATGKVTKIDKSDVQEINDYSWSPDSKWIAYSKTMPNQFNRLMLYSLDGSRTNTVSDGMTDDFQPAFDPEGKYLYFISRRTINPQFGAFELDMQYRATDKIYALSLAENTLSPVLPKSDEETGDAGGKSRDKGKDAKKGDSKTDDAKDAPPAATRIVLDGLYSRCAEIPVPVARYTGLHVFKDKLVYFALGDLDPDAEGPQGGTLHFFDFEKRKDKTVFSGITANLSFDKDGAKALYHSDETWGIVEVAEDKKVGDGKLKTDGITALVDPRQEWRQMFDEAWRLERDFYYDPAMGGLDWKAVGERYRQLVPYVAHRADLNYILGELIGELSTSHSYVGGGDLPQARRTSVGLLGADYAPDASGYYRFTHIYARRDWNSRTDAPLGEPGINVRTGDLLLEVNGHPVKTTDNLYSAFTGTAGKQTLLKVGTSANDPKARTYTVVPIASEASLRYQAWVADNREKVEKATGGRIAYIHVPNTAIAGMQEFTKQYYPQTDKDGIIVDERFNGGGFIPDFFVERLWRTTWVSWSNRDGMGFRTPQTGIDGPKCILANEYAGSGGDAFPLYFKMQGLGPIIGKRTWGGLVGISHDLPLVDGGSVTMPDFGMYDPKLGKWLVENHGVDPDIEVENAPHLMVDGHDPQLERAIQYCMDEMQKNPPKKPLLPAYKVQEGLSEAGKAAAETGQH